MAKKLMSPSQMWESGAVYQFESVVITDIRGEFEYPDRLSGNSEVGYQLTIIEPIDVEGSSEDSYMDVAFFRSALKDVKRLKLKEGDTITVRGIMRKKRKSTAYGYFHTLIVEHPGRVSKSSAI